MKNKKSTAFHAIVKKNPGRVPPTYQAIRQGKLKQEDIMTEITVSKKNLGTGHFPVSGFHKPISKIIAPHEKKR